MKGFCVTARGIEVTIRTLMIILAALIVARDVGWLTRTVILEPSNILRGPGQGKAFQIQLGGFGRFALLFSFFYPSDSNDAPFVSSLTLTEGLRKLGPPHSLHQEILEKGAGRYSYWNNWLIFAASDNSDPGTNGRVYMVAEVPNLVRLAFIPLLLIAGLLVLRLRINAPRQMPELVAVERILRNSKLWDLAAVSMLVGIQAYLLWRFGLYDWKEGDGSGYLSIAQQFAEGNNWTSVASQDFMALLRLPGYSFLILITRSFVDGIWQEAICALQMVMAVIAGFVLYRTISRISGLRLLGILAALIWALCERGRWDRAVLPDSIATSVLTLIICRLVLLAVERRPPLTRDFFTIGLGLVAVQLLRELNPIFVLATIPLMILVARQRCSHFVKILSRLAGFLIPVTITVLLILVWNYQRSGQLVYTTSATALVLPLSEAQQETGSIFQGNSPLDLVARTTLHEYSIQEINAIPIELSSKYDLSYVQVSRIISARYLLAWKDDFSVMFKLSLRRLAMWQDVLEPLALVDWPNGEYVYSGYTPDFKRLFWSCLVGLPVVWALFAVCFSPMRHDALIVCSLIIFCLVPVLVYGAIHVEIRYLLFTIAPFIIIMALSVRGFVFLMRRLYVYSGLKADPTPRVSSK
jgi:hypothetical protein